MRTRSSSWPSATSTPGTRSPSTIARSRRVGRRGRWGACGVRRQLRRRVVRSRRGATARRLAVQRAGPGAGRRAARGAGAGFVDRGRPGARGTGAAPRLPGARGDRHPHGGNRPRGGAVPARDVGARVARPRALADEPRRALVLARRRSVVAADRRVLVSPAVAVLGRVAVPDGGLRPRRGARAAVRHPGGGASGRRTSRGRPTWRRGGTSTAPGGWTPPWPPGR